MVDHSQRTVSYPTHPCTVHANACQCMSNAVMYHKSVFELMINELHPDTSKEMSQWEKHHNKQVMVNDYYIPWMLSRSGFKVSSMKVVKSNVQTKKFKSSVRCNGDWKTKYDGTLDDNTSYSFDGLYNIFRSKIGR
jgi:hypothetical protein